jgi:ubiquinone/menaquinone biosynthesis C-methylase UbiE
MPDVHERWRTERIPAALYDMGVEHERFARVAGAALWGFDTRPFYAELRLIGDLPAGSAVIDVPCGGGVAFRGVKQGQDIRYVAGDLNPTMRGRAQREADRRGLSQIEVVDADIYGLEYPDDSFDLALTYNGLHCLPDPAAALLELTRVLKPGGTLRGSSIVTGGGRRQDGVISVYERAGIFGVTPSLESLRGWIQAAGVDNVEIKTSGAMASFEGVQKGSD